LFNSFNNKHLQYFSSLFVDLVQKMQKYLCPAMRELESAPPVGGAATVQEGMMMKKCIAAAPLPAAASILLDESGFGAAGRSEICTSEKAGTGTNNYTPTNLSLFGYAGGWLAS
jgi:hypothetical protein